MTLDAVTLETQSDTLVATTRAMASEVTIKVARRKADPTVTGRVMNRALAVFHEVHETCTRFDSSSPLMRTNASPRRWHRVPSVLFDALSEAYQAYERTAGVFDPRVVRSLVALGYDSSLPFGGDVQLAGRGEESPIQGPWRPRFRSHKRDVWIDEPVDLGGIGKGLAVRWAASRLAAHTSDFLVEAGGDCYLSGVAPDGEPWRVGVEDPLGAPTPVAVLALRDRAVATSSTRLRHWRVGEERVHHLIDPRTGRSGGHGLAAVTVVAEDPAAAEVETKVLFLAGRDAIAGVARRRGVAALWCDDEGTMRTSRAMSPYVTWVRP